MILGLLDIEGVVRPADDWRASNLSIARSENRGAGVLVLRR
jgi:hypothetical protein